MRLHAIPLGTPFLPALARGVLARLGAGEALARATILLPTQRSARALRSAFLDASEAPALLLPRMRALAGLSTEEADELSLPALLDLPPAVDAMRRQSVLAALVTRHRPERGAPPAAAQAWNLAGELAKLLDEIALEEREELPDNPAATTEAWLDRLDALAPDALAEHWQITTRFLRIVVRGWVRWLGEHELLDIGFRRVLALRVQRREWEARPPADAIIAAGIGAGGTIPAAAELLRLIARDLPQGCVVIPGEDAATAAVEAAVMDAACTHPFGGQRRLLRQLGAEPLDVTPWEGCEGIAASPRANLLGMALLPHQALGPWQDRTPDWWGPALEHLTLLEAPDAQGEAAGIALAMRGCLEGARTAGAKLEGAKLERAKLEGAGLEAGIGAGIGARIGARIGGDVRRVALVTPDRDLAARVAAELPRHGLVADDSAGRPLDGVPAGAFLRLIAQAVAEGFAPVPLLALLKHPLCAAGHERAQWSRAVRRLEEAALRGPRPAPGLVGLRAQVAARGRALPEAALVLDALERCLGAFAEQRPGPSPPAERLQLHLAAAEALAATPSLPGGLRLYASEEGEPLARHLAEMGAGFEHMAPVAGGEYPALFAAALACGTARCLRVTRGRDAAAHPQVEMLGLLEARLLDFDCVILGALDEAVWPLSADPGPWMSRPMRREFGLPEPEMRIGRVASDFLMTACSARVAVLSRAARRGGAPAVPARWITRLRTFLSGQRAADGEGLDLPRSHAAAWAAGLDMPRGEARPAGRPRPAPPPDARPRRLTVTDIAVLMADPYGFYARRILGLRRLDELDADPGVAEYGELVHHAMRLFLDSLPPPAAPWPGEARAVALWADASERALAEEKPTPGLEAIWRERLRRIGGFVRGAEAASRGGLRRTLSEAEARFELTRPLGTITIEGRADRLDELADGRLRIIDYKTGSVPSRDAVRLGSAPQLPVEAWLAEHGAFAGVPAAHVAALEYWRLAGGAEPGEVTSLGEGPKALELGAAMLLARRAVEDFADHFLLGTRPFVARPHPRRDRRSDYDHLARVQEWAGGQP